MVNRCSIDYFADLLKKGQQPGAALSGGTNVKRTAWSTYALIVGAIVLLLIMINWKRMKAFIPPWVTKGSATVEGTKQIKRSSEEGSKIDDDGGDSDDIGVSEDSDEIDESDEHDFTDGAEEYDGHGVDHDDHEQEQGAHLSESIGTKGEFDEEFTDTKQTLIEYAEDPNFTLIS